MTTPKLGIPADLVRELLSYDPETGVFTWRKRTAICVTVGNRAGTVDKLGYRQITVKHSIYREHRLAWLLMTGKWPTAEIDHVNGNPGDNRWANLREATRSQNGMNTKPHRDNACGLKGANWHKATERWRAGIKVNGKIIHLGFFDTKELAHAAYCAAAEKHFGRFARAA